jgi:GATA-binding protein, other eukaryote
MGGAPACAGCPTFNNINAAASRATTSNVKQQRPLQNQQQQAGLQTKGHPQLLKQNPQAVTDAPTANEDQVMLDESSALNDDEAPSATHPRFRARFAAIGAMICTNCGTSTTPLWRRDNMGNTICNACGACLFFRLNFHDVGCNDASDPTFKNLSRAPMAGYFIATSITGYTPSVSTIR